MAETCTQYLFATKDDLRRPDFEGAKFVFSPAARTVRDQEVLWTALGNGMLESISSDHSAANFSQKFVGKDNFTRIPNGAPGIEERPMMTYRGVESGRLTLEQFVKVTSTRPAQVFGLYPKKGVIAVGADADIAIWDPKVRFTLTNDLLHHAVDHTNYEGVVVTCAPRTVLLRGKVIVENREYVGTPGEGQFLRRNRFKPRPAANID
jgi:dihydropyrimidinase